ncbi:GNAT family N-acetyltransferase [Legionella sp. km535]|uniref:GNAT family N-acetyltransferase n=1 Tax=Legionella sp. km535 TaxID=2498107 RepID=UPI000F8EA97C|nr:GNAT family N-acetyltransferase [Legionella sp. km535]RUR20358.1 GNAT family N-acetyltransferase [Legionella sp. km535]
MNIRATEESDWLILKETRLAALRDTPTAFGVSYQTAITDSDEQWKERASAKTHPKFWLAFKGDQTIGMIGAGVDQSDRYNLIAMWVEPKSRGLGVAEYLVNTVKFDSIKKGFKQIFLDVSLKNLRAYRFYEKHGFVFNGEEKPLASHPEIMVQTMEWQSKK